ncbi:MAG TPA: TlpA family protein disulfide reductase [Gammaproteobacteria bacterium]|nr:TlpA family protein disulfide reductase [Gammaproteobacteria bacterium]
MGKASAGLAGMVALTTMLLAACEATAPPPDRLQPGEPFPAVTLTDLAGGEVPLSRWRGRFLVLNVWATWCAPCRRELPGLQGLSERLDPGRFAVVGLSMDDDPRVVREYLRDRGVRYTNYIDARWHVVDNILGLTVYPATYFISPQGVLLARMVGEQDWAGERIVNALEAAWHGERGALSAMAAGR